MLDGVGDAKVNHPDPHINMLEQSVIDLTARATDLIEDRDRWRKLAQAPLPTSNAEGLRTSGPLKPSATPQLPGTLPWCGLKGLKTRGPEIGYSTSEVCSGSNRRAGLICNACVRAETAMETAPTGVGGGRGQRARGDDGACHPLSDEPDRPCHAWAPDPADPGRNRQENGLHWRNDRVGVQMTPHPPPDTGAQNFSKFLIGAW
jgi:hypothetical protein